MRTVGIIAEYNPFHTGHEYHIRKAKEQSGADYAVVVMSPDYVQRGEPAVFDKYTRTRMALSCGADLILELPLVYATGSAEYFAEGAVKLLDGLGIIDTLCFGVETIPGSCHDLAYAPSVRMNNFQDQLNTDCQVTKNPAAAFQMIARILLEEPEDYRRALQDGLRHGRTYPRSRMEAMETYLKNHSASTENTVNRDLSGEKASDCGPASVILSCPNNILGVEYCKALLKLHSSITPIPLTRQGNGYLDQTLTGKYCSAGAIRNTITGNHNGSPASRQVDRYVPAACRELFRKACKTPFVSEDLLPILTQKLIARERFDDILDISEELSDRMCALRYRCIGKTFREITAMLKTKQITEARIRRALLHLILDVRKEDMEKYRLEETVSCTRILGFRRESSLLLHEIRQNRALPLISKAAHAPKLLTDTGIQMWKQDAAASHLYRGLLSARYRIPFQSEYEISPVVL